MVKTERNFAGPLFLGGAFSGFAALVCGINGGLMSKIAAGFFGLLTVGLFKKSYDVDKETTKSNTKLVKKEAPEIVKKIDVLRGELATQFKAKRKTEKEQFQKLLEENKKLFEEKK